MNKGPTIVKNEFLELLPPTIFFFIAIGLLMLTKHLVLKQYDIHVSDFAVVVVGALIIGKVVLIADHFSFVDKYPGKPLIYNVLWKTSIYFVAACVVRIAEEIIPKVVDFRKLRRDHRAGDRRDRLAALLGHPSLAWRLAVRLLCTARTYSRHRQR